ncbi:Non-specific serine/threonine protein kinase [Bertholletia excelsa]
MATRPSALIFFLLALLSIAGAEDRAPHGLAHERPSTALPPSAFQFFNPDAADHPCTGSHCSLFPEAVSVTATESKSMAEHGGSRAGTGGAIAGIVLGLVFAGLVAMGVYYVVVKRRANLSGSNTVQPDA